jgi:hypothetical protein
VSQRLYRDCVCTYVSTVVSAQLHGPAPFCRCKSPPVPSCETPSPPQGIGTEELPPGIFEFSGRMCWLGGMCDVMMIDEREQRSMKWISAERLNCSFSSIPSRDVDEMPAARSPDPCPGTSPPRQKAALRGSVCFETSTATLNPHHGSSPGPFHPIAASSPTHDFARASLVLLFQD